jgi:hypothetical protein
VRALIRSARSGQPLASPRRTGSDRTGSDRTGPDRARTAGSPRPVQRLLFD